MSSSRVLHRLVTHPHEYMRFITTGKLPKGIQPQGALVRLLRQISPRDLCELQGITIDASLGYNGQRTFDNAAQAKRWVDPAPEVFDGFPAESWRIKGFQEALTVDELIAACARAPADFLDRYPRLRSTNATRSEPAPPSAPKNSSTDSSANHGHESYANTAPNRPRNGV